MNQNHQEEAGAILETAESITEVTTEITADGLDYSAYASSGGEGNAANGPVAKLSAESLDSLSAIFAQKGAKSAVDILCQELLNCKDPTSLFYARLMQFRIENNLSPFPNQNVSEIPESLHEAYENTIRSAGREAAKLWLELGNYQASWSYYRMLGETESMVAVLEEYTDTSERDPQAIIDLAYYQGVHVVKGFSLILNRYGICNAITAYSSQDWSKYPAERQICIALLVKNLYDQLSERLYHELQNLGVASTSSESRPSVEEMVNGHPELFDGYSYHIDTSHLSSICQFALELQTGPEVASARELCLYGEKLGESFQMSLGEPFEKGYIDFRKLLEIIDGVEVEANLEYFRAKIDPAASLGRSFPAEVFVNLLLRLDRLPEALLIAKTYLLNLEHSLICPSLYELCEQAKDYKIWAESAKERRDGVYYLANLIQLGQKNP